MYLLSELNSKVLSSGVRVVCPFKMLHNDVVFPSLSRPGSKLQFRVLQ